MKKLASLAFLVFSMSAYCQEEITLNRYLKSSVSDKEITNIQEKMASLTYKDFRSPWLREVEFRGRSNDFNVSMEDFRVRLAPLNPAEVKANKVYFGILKDLNSLEYQAKLSAVLTSRYLDLIDHHYITQNIDLLKAEKEVFETTLETILKQRSSTADFVKVDRAILQVDLLLQEMNSQKTGLDLSLSTESGMTGELNWSIVEIIEAAEINAMVRESAGVVNINLDLEEKKLALESQRYQIRKKEAFRNIGYIQAEYDIDRGNDFNRHAGYQIGFQIPIVNPDKPDLARRKLDLLDDQNDLAVEKEEVAMESQQLRIKIKNSSEQIELLEAKLTKVNDLVNERSASITIDVKGWLELLEYRFYIQSRLLQEKRKLLSYYITYLGNEGSLVDNPLRNYLIQGTPVSILIQFLS